MTSTISLFSSNINVSFPVAGVNQSSQGFRDNFSQIKQGLDQAATEISNLQSKLVIVTGDVTGTSTVAGTTNGAITLALSLPTVIDAPGTYDPTAKDVILTISDKGIITELVATDIVNNVDDLATYAVDTASMGSGTGTAHFPTFKFDSAGRLKTQGTKAVTFGLLDHSLAKGQVIAGSTTSVSAATPAPGAYDGTYVLTATGNGPTGLEWTSLNIPEGTVIGVTEGPGVDVQNGSINPVIKLDISTLPDKTVIDDSDFMPFSDYIDTASKKLTFSQFKSVLATEFLAADVGATVITSTDVGGVVINSPNGITLNDNIWPTTSGSTGEVLTVNTSGQLIWSGSSNVPVTRTYYVSNDGNDTDGTGGMTTPYLTITKALTVVPTDGIVYTIALLSGVYDEDLTVTAPNVSIKGIGGVSKPILLGTIVIESGTTFVGFENLKFDRTTQAVEVSDPAIAASSDLNYLQVLDCDFLRGSGPKAQLPIISLSGTLTSGVLFDNCAFQGQVETSLVSASTDVRTVISNVRQLGSREFGLTVGGHTSLINVPQITGIAHTGGDLVLENIGAVTAKTYSTTVPDAPQYVVDADNNAVHTGDIAVSPPAIVLDATGKPVQETSDGTIGGTPLFANDGVTPLWKTTNYKQDITQTSTTADRSVGIYSTSNTGVLRLHDVNLYNGTDYAPVIKVGNSAWMFTNVQRRADLDVIHGQRIALDVQPDSGDFMPRYKSDSSGLKYIDDSPVPYGKLDPLQAKAIHITLVGTGSHLSLKTPDSTLLDSGADSAELVAELTVFIQQDATGGRNATWSSDNEPELIWYTDYALDDAPNAITIYKFYYHTTTRQWYGLRASKGPQRTRVFVNATTTFTPTLQHANSFISLSDATGVSFEIDSASANFPVGTWFEIEQAGSGLVAVSASGGDSVLLPAGQTAQTLEQYQVIRVIKRDPTTWVVMNTAVSGGSGTWGAITGTLSAQTDLAAALSGKEPTIAAGTTSQYRRGDKSWQTLDKNAVGLANVDNTSDLNKPLSTAAINALALKADLSGDNSFTGANTFTDAPLVGALPVLTANETITLSGDVSGSGSTSITTAIGANKVTRGMLAATAGAAILGATAAGNVSDLSGSAATGLLDVVVGDTGSGGAKGLVPAPVAGDSAAGKYLKADGTWAVPAGGGVAGTTSSAVTFNSSGTGAASGSTFDGSVARTVSYNTIGAQPAGSYQTQDATLTNLAALSWVSGAQIPVMTAADTFALRTIGAASGNLLDKESADTLYQPVGGYLTAVNWGDIGGTLSNQTDLQSALNAKEGSITAGTTSQYWRGDKSWQTLDKTAVGLSNVDNTNDLSKPVSTATQTALNLKANLAGATFTGAISATNLSGTNTGDQDISGLQPLDADLTAIAGLAGTSGLLKKTAANTWSLDTSAYLTSNQTITLSGDLTGSGSTAINATIAPSSITLAKMANVATGTVFYRKTSGAGAPEVQTLATLKTDLGISGTNTGDQTITLTGDVTGSGTGSFVTTIGSNKVSRSMMTATTGAAILGATAAGNVSDLSGTQATTLLTVFGSAAKGLAPASGGGTSNFLRADGTWAIPAATTTSALTFNNGGAGAASGSIFDGSVARTISYNTLGAAPAANPTFTGVVTAPTINNSTGVSLQYGGSARLTTASGGINLGGVDNPTIFFFDANNAQRAAITGPSVSDQTLYLNADALNIFDAAHSSIFADANSNGWTFYSGGNVQLDVSNTTITSYTDLIVDGSVRSSNIQLVKVASTANFANSTPTNTKLTATSNGATIVDGVTLAISDYVLLKDQSIASQNGIYIVTTAGTATTKTVLNRVDGVDTWAGISSGTRVTVKSGTTNADTQWLCIADTGGSLGSTAISFKKLLTATDTFTSTNAGVAPASGGDTNNFLRADGNWSQVAYSQLTGTPSLAAVATSGSASDLTTGTLTATRLPAFSGDVSSAAGSASLSIGANKVTRGMLAVTTGAGLLGATSAGNVSDLTGTQATSLLDVFTNAAKGVTPASGGGTTNFLRADGTWSIPVGPVANNLTFNNSGSGIASGSTFNGNAAATVSYNTIGAQASSALLTAYANQNWGAGVQVPTLTASNTIALKTVGSATGNLLDKASGDTLYQPLDGDLTSIAGLAGTTGLLKKTAANTWVLDTTAYGTGTVTTVSVSTLNGISATVANATTTPQLTLSLGAITPTSVASAGSVSGTVLSASNSFQYRAANAALNIFSRGDVNTTNVEAFTPDLVTWGTLLLAGATIKLNNGITTIATVTNTGMAVTGSLSATGTISGSNLSGTNTGDQTITLTGDITGTGTGSFATTIGANKVTFSKLVAATQAAFIGTTAAGNFGELTPTQATAQLNPMVGANGTVGGTKGLVPVPVATDNTKFLRGDGTWQAVSGAGGGGTTTTALTFSNTGTGAAAGITFDGSTARTISYNTIGAAPTASPTFTGVVTAPTIDSLTGVNLQYGSTTKLTTTSEGIKLGGVTAGPTIYFHDTGDTLKAMIAGPDDSGSDLTFFADGHQFWDKAGSNILMDIDAGGLSFYANNNEQLTLNSSSLYSNVNFVSEGTIRSANIQTARVASTANFTNTTPTALQLTASAVGSTTIDGVTLGVSDYVLLKDQTLPAQNGVYVVITAGDSTHKTLLGRIPNTWAKVAAGATVTVTTGTTNADTIWLCTADQGGTLGTTAINFKKVTTATDTFTSAVAGVVPASGGGTTNFLRADGLWATPAGTGGTGGTTANPLTFNNSGSGIASGSIFDGSTARTVSYNTIGAAPLASPAFTGTPSATSGTFEVNGASSPTLKIKSNVSTAQAAGAISFRDSSNIEYATVYTNNKSNLLLYADGNISLNPGNLILLASPVSITSTLQASELYSVGAASTANFANTPTVLTLTATATGVTVLDGITLTADMTVLLKDQTLPEQNGVYTVTTAGATGVATVLARVFELNTWSAITGGTKVTVTDGTLNAHTLWLCTANVSGTLGTTAVNFKKIPTATDTFTSALTGVVPASGGGTSNFLRADGTWAAPPTSGSTTANALTFSTSGGATAGATFDGSVARTIDYSTVGAQRLDATLTNFASLAWVSGTQVPVLTAADTFSLKTVGSGSGNLLDKAAGDSLYTPILTPINPQAGTTYTLALTDSYVRFTGSSAVTVTVPLNSAIAFPIGTQIAIFQKGTGQVTIAGTVGVTINATSLSLRTQYSSASLVKVATNEWDLVGDLT